MSDLQVTTRSGAKDFLQDASVRELAAGLRGQLVTPKSADYHGVRRLWNGMHDKRPALIARCVGTADVIASVNFARDHGLLTAVRSGGHSVAGYSSCDGGMVVDLSLMKGVHVNPKSRSVRVQGGATLGDMDRETQVHGLAVPGGNVSTTGVAGLTLGGGMGHLRRKYGLTIDNLLSADLVTAEGKVLTASKNENAELFWGIRGGGGNFGVVTSFEFRAHPVGPVVTLCAPWYAVDHARELLTEWAAFMATAPEEFSSIAMLWTVPSVADIPQELHGKRALLLGGVHCGPLEEGQQAIQPLRELERPLMDWSGPMTWTAVQSMADGFYPAGTRRYYFKSCYLRDLDGETLDALLPWAADPMSPQGAIAIWHQGGAMHRVGSAETAFTERRAPFLLSVDLDWDNEKQTEEVIEYARRGLAKMEPHAASGAYVNFDGLPGEDESLVKDAYGESYSRLVELKTRYDPSNLFRLNRNITPMT